MPTFLQPVTLPERCFLHEVLLWVAFQRLPVASYTIDGKELRETDEIGGYAIEFSEEALWEDETQRAGIPRDPKSVALLDEDSTMLPVAHFDEWLAKPGLEDDFRKHMEAQREAAKVYEAECHAWEPHYQRAVEYPASRIFVALKSGGLSAKGRLLPNPDVEVALGILQADDLHFFDLALTDIPGVFWSLKGIDFKASAAISGSDHYCHISCRTEDLLSVFPGEREEVVGVARIGDAFVLTEGRSAVRAALSGRGRPPYDWDAFHLEVAELVRRNDLPAKKEAAIAYFQEWFRRERSAEVSRSVLGSKLKPYYDAFVRPGGQKIR